MQLDVYDTYAQSADGAELHFDVLVPQGTGENVRKYALTWLDEMGISSTGLSIDRCNFCHSEPASPEIAAQLKRDGYFIVQMEGCPCPVY